MAENALSSTSAIHITSQQESIIERLYDIGALKFGKFTLKSGIKSPIYVDLRLTVSHPLLLKDISTALLDKVKNVSHDLLCGVPYTAIPFATSMSLSSGKPMLLRRKEIKSHGTKCIIEGVFEPGQNVLVVEDLVTSGLSVMETVSPLREQKLIADDVVVLLDRQQGAAANLESNNVVLHFVFTISDMLNVLVSIGKISSSMRDSVRKFIAENQVSNGVSVAPAIRNVNSREASEPTPVPSRLTYLQRAKYVEHSVARRLLNIMESKKSNLAVAADVTSSVALLDIAEATGPDIVMLKTHADIVTDWTDETAASLLDVASRHNFLIFEDRKFADIGNTAFHQVSAGVHRISAWADIVNAHAVPGPGVIAGLAKAADNATENNDCRRFGIILLAQMSSQGNLASLLPGYTQKTIDIARSHKNYVFGFISMGNIAGDGFIYMTPGVNMGTSGDSLGQQYATPDSVIAEKGSDIIIVGRGIYKAEDKSAAAKTYRQAGWAAYEKRCNGAQ